MVLAAEHAPAGTTGHGSTFTALDPYHPSRLHGGTMWQLTIRIVGMAANGTSMRRRNCPDPCAQRSGGGWATIDLQWVAIGNVA